MLKVTPNGDGTYTKINLPYLFNTSPVNNHIEAVAANGNILTSDLSAYANYCYVNTGNNTYTKTELSTSPETKLRAHILAGVNYVWGQSNTMNGGITYLGFDGLPIANGSQPIVNTKMNSNNCSPDYSSYLVNLNGPLEMTNKYALIGSSYISITRVANINTVSNGADGN
jgi:hypothetical protein